MLGGTLDNIAILIGISTEIIPNIISIVVVIGLILATFKMNLNGITASIIVLALYTVSMALLTILGIDSVVNIFTLIGGSL
jgi:hypothetical protein